MTPRVALFADCFHEINGVALTCRQLEAFAQRRGLPLLNVHAGNDTLAGTEGGVRRLPLRRSPIALRLDSDLSFDFLCMRQRGRAVQAAREFKAEVVHITAPGDMGFWEPWWHTSSPFLWWPPGTPTFMSSAHAGWSGSWPGRPRPGAAGPPPGRNVHHSTA